MAENDPVQCGSITSEVLQTYYDSIGRPWTLIRKPANPDNLPQLLNAGASLLLEQGDRNYGTLQFGGVISGGSVSAGAGGGSIWSGKRPTASNTASNYYPLGFEMGLSSTGGATNGIAITGYGGILLMSIGPNGTIRDYSGVDILTATSLGVNVINSSLRTVGNLNSLNVTGNLAIKPAANLLVADATTEYVGIGTGTPSQKLDVTGNCNLATTHTYKIGGANVLSETTLGANVVNSSLTSVGTLVGLDVSGNITANTISGSVATPSITCSGNITQTSGTNTLKSTSVDLLTVTNYNSWTGPNTDANNIFSAYVNSNRLAFQTWSKTGSLAGTEILFYTSSAGSNVVSQAMRLDSTQGTWFYGDIAQTSTKTAYMGTISMAGNLTQTNTKTASLGALTVPSLTCSGDVVVDTNTFKVDSTNNRVGINTTNPAYDLDVTGVLRVTGVTSLEGGLNVSSINVNGSGSVISATGDPEGSITASVGSLFLRADGAAGTTLYTKQTGTGNTGWAAVATTTSTSNTTIYKNAAAVNNTAVALNTQSFQTILSFTIPANSVCLIDIVTTMKKIASGTHANVYMRLQSSTAPQFPALDNKQNCYLFTYPSVTFQPVVMYNGTTVNHEITGHLVLAELQTNTTASPITLYLGFSLGPDANYSTPANLVQIPINSAVVTVTKVGTI